MKMKATAKLASLIALCATVIPCLLYFAGAIGHDAVKWSALAGTLGFGRSVGNTFAIPRLDRSTNS